jgi:hypothetical protein
MIRLLAFVALALGALFLESRPFAAPATKVWREWLAATALPASLERVTAVELSAPGIDSLSAALVLRAVLPLQPKGIVFLDPVASDSSSSLLLSKLGDARVPVVFSASQNLDALPNVRIARAAPALPLSPALVPGGIPLGSPSGGGQIVARQGKDAVPSSVLKALLLAKKSATQNVAGSVPGVLQVEGAVIPVDARGRTATNPLAALALERIDCGALLVRTEQSERGEIGAGLDTLFRDRWVAVQLAGKSGAATLAAVLNNLAESTLPWTGAAGVLVVVVMAFLPRRGRFLAACGVSCCWALMALACWREFHLASPWFPVLLAPVLAALIPARRAI